MLTASMTTSCSDDDPVQKAACRIVTVQYSGTTHNITYNSEGKVSTTSYGDIHRNFQYTNHTVVMNQTENGNFSEKITYTLNNDGLVANKKVEKNPSGTIWENTAFEYDGIKLHEAVTTYSGSSATDVETLTWSNGNPIKSVNNGNTATLEYYTDKPAKDGDYFHVLQLINFGTFYLKTKNPVKSSQGSNFLTTCEYTYDTDGKISAMTVNNGSPQPTIVTYQYQCN
jgi:hypothetical protein